MTKPFLCMALLVAVCVLSGGAAVAQNDAQNYADVARNTGHRDGREKGANDARQAKSYNLERHDYYRDADHGYRSRGGNKEDYRRQYRDAFREGYEQGYRGDRGDRGRRPGSGSGVFTGRRDDGSGGPFPQQGGNNSDVARNTGFRDGREKGENDARQAKSYSLERHDYFRDADHGYRGNFGNKEDYRRQYRDAFRDGYEQGYRGRRRR